VRSRSKTLMATPVSIIQEWANDPRFIPIGGDLLYVGNTSGRCACGTIGHGQAGRCLMHARLLADNGTPKGHLAH